MKMIMTTKNDSVLYAWKKKNLLLANEWETENDNDYDDACTIWLYVQTEKEQAILQLLLVQRATTTNRLKCCYQWRRWYFLCMNAGNPFWWNCDKNIIKITQWIIIIEIILAFSPRESRRYQTLLGAINWQLGTFSSSTRLADRSVESANCWLLAYELVRQSITWVCRCRRWW